MDRRGKIGRALARGALIVAPGALGLALLLISRPLAGAEMPVGRPSAIPPLCSGWHRGDGQSRAFDLDSTERGYREFREAFARSLSQSLEDHRAKVGLVEYDAGLPACTRAERRRVTPPSALPDALRGQTIWLFSTAPGRSPRIPKDVERDPSAIPLATKLESLEDLAKLSRLFARPVRLAPRGLAEALGVRCVPALVSISSDGGIELHEHP
jgi:hypothetical protein